MIPPIPEAAMPVVLVLRRDVRKPSTEGWHSLVPDKWGYCRSRSICCPMGLHPNAMSRAPGLAETFGCAGVNTDNVGNFADWFDAIPLADLQAAFDLIWPEG